MTGAAYGIGFAMAQELAEAGVTCVGMGSNLFPKEAIAAKDWSAVTRLCKDALAIISDVK